MRYVIKSALAVIFILLGSYYILTGNMPTKNNMKSSIEGWKAKHEERTRDEDKHEDVSLQVTPIVVTGVLEEQEAVPRYDVVYLYLDTSIKFPVRIPEGMDVVTDYDKFIYAKDNSFSAVVVSGVEATSLSEITGVRDATVISTDIVRSEKDTPGPLEAARLVVNDKAVVIRSYVSSAFFTTALKGLQECDYEIVKPKQMSDIPTRVLVNSIPEACVCDYVITYNVESSMSENYILIDGTLSITKEYRKFEDACLYVWERVSSSAGVKNPSKLYVTDTEFYVEAGNITAYAYAVNFNTTLRLFGVGEAARNNIRTYAR